MKSVLTDGSTLQINYRDILVPILGEGTVLINLSTDVSSLALIELCRSAGALYL
ncbi:saccharopine dehydrogenase NADP-binding domain-containing protein, partial [Pseudomonas aeruginosa]